MIRYGIRTWKYIAFPAVLFMILSSFLFVKSCNIKRQLIEEVGQYGRITCMLEDRQEEQLETIYDGKIDGSYMYEREEKFSYEAVEKVYPVTGISSKMLLGDLLAGSLYTDENNVFAIVVNKEFLIDLTDRRMNAEEELEVWIAKTLTMEKSAVKISGVIDDQMLTPRVYMSVAAIHSYIQQQGEIPRADFFCIAVPDLKSMEQMQNKLNEIGIETDIDYEKMQEWKLKRIRSFDLRLMSALVFGGFVSNILLTIKMKNQQSNDMNKIVLAVEVVTNILMGSLVGWLVFEFVQLWQI